MKAKAFVFVLFLLAPIATIAQQRTEVTISLNEQFFDSLLDAIYQNSPPPEFQLSKAEQKTSVTAYRNAFAPESQPICASSVTLLRENKSVRTSVRLRDGKIVAPVAFTGNYSPPLIGCIDFSGHAETIVDLQFDRATQKLVGRVKVRNVNLDGTGGIGGSLIARMVQGSIDKKMNPIEIISIDKLSFPFTLPNSAKLKMRAIEVRHEVVPGALNIIISYEFVKD